MLLKPFAMAGGAVAIGLLSLGAQAQTEPSSSSASSDEPPRLAFNLDPVVVTPTLTSQTSEASMTSVTVIDEQQLREQQPTQFTDVLLGQPGVDVVGNGGFGKTTSVYMRGTGSSSTLLLVDGVRLRSATAGSPSWQFLPPSLIDRVEIVRGPRASLYGADALGGVVQVFTPNGERPGGWIELGGGSFGSQEVGAGFATEQNGTRLSVGVDRFRTAGSEIREHSEDRGYDNTSGVARLSHRFDNGGEIGVSGLRAQGNTEFEGSTPAQDTNTDYVMQVASVYADMPLTDAWVSRLQISEAKDQNENYTDGVNDSVFDTRTRIVHWRNTFAFGAHQFVAGAEFLRDQIDSSTAYLEDRRDNSAAFVQALLNFGPADVQTSVRYDDNEAFGGKTTGALALGYKLDAHHRLRASYASAFRAPTFNDLYYPGFGNEALDPESSRSGELGARGQYQNWFWDLALFQTDVDDLIDYATRDGRYAPYNVNEARIRGAELSAGVELDQWRLVAAVTALDPRDKETDNVLQRRATRSLRLDLDRTLGDVTLGGSAIFQNHRYNDAANDQRLPGYGMLNLRAGWRFAPGWSTRFTVRNLFDRQYTTSRNFSGWDYLNPGRAMFLSLRYDTR
ncbi:TonB-dependent receptor domain-containing protein [Alloalcanivorax mobilis]|uniref:TonB-dependent receptor domain-containing protein n=1 Tax=Alloalcanivorax mobilis TaxID=2019569 RepID=UPI000C786E0A|nr:TonB-dependent receptor [Alloalcanivorax mobilis]